MIRYKVTLLDGSTREYETWDEYWDEEGSLIFHSYDDKPAYIWYRGDGSIRREVWYKEGKRHREGDKPAKIWYNRDGSVLTQYWYKEGKQITEKEAKTYALCEDGHDYVEAACGDYKANVVGDA